jgi:hypothetical protein
LTYNHSSSDTSGLAITRSLTVTKQDYPIRRKRRERRFC